MKLIKNIHIVQVIMSPMHALSSHYFNKVREIHTDPESRLLKQGFEDGYERCLLDLGISKRDHPSGKREHIEK